MKKHALFFIIFITLISCNGSWNRTPGVVVYRELLKKNDSCEIWIKTEYRISNVYFDTIRSSGELNSIQPDITSRYNR